MYLHHEDGRPWPDAGTLNVVLEMLDGLLVRGSLAYEYVDARLPVVDDDGLLTVDPANSDDRLVKVVKEDKVWIMSR
jgi:hypothetical protein